MLRYWLEQPGSRQATPAHLLKYMYTQGQFYKDTRYEPSKGQVAHNLVNIRELLTFVLEQ